MREFTFDIVYEKGADQVMDVFIEYPTLVAEALHGCVSGDSFWRVERLTGPTAALDAVERLLLDETVRTASVTETDCRATRTHDVLDRSDNERVIYTHLEGIENGDTIQTLSARYLPAGSLFCTIRREERHGWRICMQSDEKVGLLYDALSANLRSGLSFRMGHLGEAEGWGHDSLGSVSLPPDQRRAMRAALDHGYYRTPREITLDELAEIMDVPRSTLSYRLRRAEERLVTGYLGET
ncbi:helix-turn-helix domain-containing protein [Haloplanus aerogenes]|uniref:Bacterio-opsin activator n=1 Tax=Haloplanus aerogenes TaxID=660522 RepID=A0A3M0CYZ6_9EURY|nr:helix-turn-helix domain-containing protein [Haloplanus aerogenes]AZH25203.1 bacterio-opsin activator [Haloplanus aerogenes]RMB13570.1 DNA binding protein with HTH domain [Haloplanus aerogenes]